MSTILVTGVAGFIGLGVARALLSRGDVVIGIDNLNASYDVVLKEARLALLHSQRHFKFHKLDVAGREAVSWLAEEYPEIDGIVHLAAYSGVHQSVTDPYSHVTANIMGQTVMLELSRRLNRLTHFIYASSCAVYGANRKYPFAVGDPVEKPSSPYAATKRTAELLGQVYAHLYGIPSTGLRFGTVYGPWGRPDAAASIFTRQILAGEPITVFNLGEISRDFVYIDDIVDGVVKTLSRPHRTEQAHRLYNFGSDRPEKLMSLVAEIERATARKARIVFEPMPPGDMPMSYCDIESSRRDLGFEPSVPLGVGIPRFVAWLRDYYRL